MVDDQTGRIKDPQALRALTHPLRWKLIDVLTAHGQATATRCAAILGESVASCSHHLHMLAKYGFIEPAPASGREKPWRMATIRQNLSGAGMGQEGEQAALAATEVFLHHEHTKLVERLRALDREPPGWREATGVTGATTWLTVEELRELTEQLTELTRRYAGRIDNPSTRPPDAREVRIFVATTVAPTGSDPHDSAT